MSELSASHMAEIIGRYGVIEFEKFQNALIATAEEFNSHISGNDKFDTASATFTDKGSIGFKDCRFEYKLDQGDAPEKADIMYRFCTATASPGKTNGNGSMSLVEHAELPGDPRNTPWMRYEPELIGAGTQPGQFAFYWDGEATEELAESLLKEFIEWCA
jgi:hypothetical protein